jgi:predicted metal-dependent hydrolase
MSHKSDKVAAIIHPLRGRRFDPHYLGFFECFNRQLFFEAHEVLEELWLQHRGTSKNAFYKGLIQLAGAFVHIQKKRVQPAVALFKLARNNLAGYPITYDALDLGSLQGMINWWIDFLEKSAEAVPVEAVAWPSLFLENTNLQITTAAPWIANPKV